MRAREYEKHLYAAISRLLANRERAPEDAAGGDVDLAPSVSDDAATEPSLRAPTPIEVLDRSARLNATEARLREAQDVLREIAETQHIADHGGTLEACPACLARAYFTELRGAGEAV